MSGNKNKTYTKEELLKLIKDNATLPENADDFDKEALEGLKLLKNENLLNKLTNEVDALAKQKERKKIIYYISAAASLILIIGLIIFFKNEVKTSEEKVVADANEIKKEPEKSYETPTALEEKQVEAKPDGLEKSKEKTTLSSSGEGVEQPKISDAVAQQHIAMAPVATSKDELDQTISVQNNNVANNEPAFAQSAGEADANTKSAGNDTREEFQHQASKNMNNVALAQGGVAYDEQKSAEKEFKSKKTATAPSSAALAKNDNAKKADSKEKNSAMLNEVVVTENAPKIDGQISRDEELRPPPETANKKALESAALSKKEEKIAADEMAKPSAFYANSEVKAKTENKYVLPSFIGGDTAFVSYAKQHLKISSPNISGKITVAFTVTKNGKAEKIKITAPISGCDACSNDVIELIKSIKSWQPATINNKAVDYPKVLVVQYN